MPTITEAKNSGAPADSTQRRLVSESADMERRRRMEEIKEEGEVLAEEMR